MGNSHTIWDHTEVRIPRLPPAKVGTRFSNPKGMQGWVDLCYVKADRLRIPNKWWKNFDGRLHRMVWQIFHRDNLIWYQPVRSIAAGSSNYAVMPLLTLLLHTLQPRLPLVCHELDNPQHCLFPRGVKGISTPTPSNTWFLGPTGVSPPNCISIG